MIEIRQGEPEMINVGDVVSVDFTTSQSISRAVVIYKPGATGDSWIVKTIVGGQVIHIMVFERMNLLPEKGKWNKGKWVAQELN